MAQQFPYNPAGSGLPPMPPMLPNMGGPGPGLNVPGGLPPMDPRLLQQMQQAANQGGGDSVMLDMASSMLPSPTGVISGALVGIGAHAGIDKFIHSKNEYLPRLAQWVDRQFSRIPIIGKWNQKYDQKVLSRIQNSNSDYLKQLFMQVAPEEMEKNLIQHQIKALRSTWLERAAARLDGWFGGQRFNNLANRILKPLRSSSMPEWIQKRAIGKLDAKYVDRLSSLTSIKDVHAEIDLIKKEMSGGSKYGRFLFNRDYKRLDGLRKSLQGLQTFYLKGYEQQYNTLSVLSKETGPVGRFVANVTHHLNRIFGGEFLGIAGKAAQTGSGWMGKVLGPGLAGMMSFGMAVSESQKAEKGDKVSTFFHSFLGLGIAQMIGFEVAHKLLRPIVTKSLSVMATWQLPGLLRLVPMLGKATWLGFAAEIVGMMVLSQPFQKVGEWVSDKIFGRPKSVAKAEAKEAQEAAQAEMAKKMPQGLPALQQLPQGNPAVFQPFLQDKRIPAPAMSAAPLPAPMLPAIPHQPAVHHGGFSMTPEEIMADLPVYNQDQQIQQQFTQALGDGHIEPGQLYTNPFAYGVATH